MSRTAAQKYKTILCDIPLASNQPKFGEREPEKHYPCLSVEALKQMQPPADKDAVLLFWAWNQRLPECLEIVEAWGFTYRTLITWVKPHMGLGNYVRNATEHILVCSRGKKALKKNGRLLTWFIAERRQHSRKPEMQYELAEALGSGPYLEMFARQTRNGWDAWGNETSKFDALQ